MTLFPSRHTARILVPMNTNTTTTPADSIRRVRCVETNDSMFVTADGMRFENYGDAFAWVTSR